MPEAITPEQLSQRIMDAALLDSRQMDSLWAELGTREVQLEDLTSLLLRKEVLTNFQLDRLFKGERGGYFYGDFKVLYLIGNGTFARVYRAVDVKTGRIVAVKSLRKRFRDDREMTVQFIREGKIGMQLRHPNIVPIYEADHLPTPHLTMEFVEGRNLREFIRVRKKMEPLEALRLGVDILAGLAYAAERGHTHRDLKMSNVLVTSRGQAKLVDFGLAGIQVSSGKQDDASNPRTIDYAGLERASGVRNNDPRSDLFFAGAILYNLLTGVSPMGEARDRLSRLAIARYQNIKPIAAHDSIIPDRLAAFVMRALELNPEKRYGSAKEMHDDAKRLLTRLQAGESLDVDPAEAPAGPAEAAAEAKIAADQEGTNRTVLVIESKIEMQDVLRDRLKRHGYRVLVFSDPRRALQRFLDADHKLADCVLCSATELGDAALQAFNELGTHEVTRDIPAILFVDNRQSNLIEAANLNEHRVLLSMPLKLRELRVALLKLLRPQVNVG
ncbi:MAG: protein kinase [Pirellulaceae bacterium]